MQTYAKYINEHQIELAPKNKGAVSNYDHDIELMTVDGYLPVVVVEEPTADKPVVKYRQNEGAIEQYTAEKNIDRKSEEVRTLRNARIEAMRPRIERYQNQKAAEIPTTDTAETYMDFLLYLQYLRDIPDLPDFPNVEVAGFDKWREAQTVVEEKGESDE